MSTIRDPRKIAGDLTIESVLQSAYKTVFGYRPELGEPDMVGSLPVYHVHGFRFSLGPDGDLQVEDRAGRFRAIPNLYVFKTLYERGGLYES